MIKIINPPIKLTKAVMEFLNECSRRGKTCSYEDIVGYFSKTESYVKKCIDFLLNKEILIEKEGKYSLSKEVQKQVNQNNSLQIVKETLAKDKLFAEYVYFVSNGKSNQEAAKLVKTVYGIEQKENVITQVFNEWISLLEINVSNKRYKNPSIENLEAIKNKVQANKFLKNELNEFFKDVSTKVLDDLSEAIVNIKSNKEDAVNDTGRALEDFLRLDLASDINLEKCAGIVQITNELNKHPEYPTKLNNIAASLGNVRSMGKAHGADAKLKQRWTITETAAFSYILMVICLIKSYLEYKNNKKSIF
ncbi:hypothetical protein KY343_02650 [Candidatus Woesearchaeota archaeon]|nr:hypothetical protein [Candidatus Woesearchaeota archaeon]